MATPAFQSERLGLAALLDADNCREFMGDLWPTRPLLVHGNPQRLRGLIDLPELSNVAQQLRITRGALRASTMNDGRQVEQEPTSDEHALELHARGFTLLFISMQSPALSAWARTVERDCRLPPSVVRVHSFACLGAERLATHCDPASVFVVQVRGRKRWRIAPNEHVQFPTDWFALDDARPREDWSRSLHVQAPNGLPASMPECHQVVDMEPGSVMFLPRGYWHDAEVVGTESVHLVIVVRQPTWADLLHFALRLTPALDSIAWREPAPNLFENGAFRIEVLRELSARLPELLRTIEGQARDVEQGDVARACASIGFR